LEISLLQLHDSCHEFMQRLRRSRSSWKIIAGIFQRHGGIDYLEIDDVCQLLVSAEAVAAMRGWAHTDFDVEFLHAEFAERQDLDAVAQTASRAVRRIKEEKNELLDACSPERLLALLSALNDLHERLVRPPKSFPQARAGRTKRLRPGDVFRIPVSADRCAFGRIHRSGYVYVYAGLWRWNDPAPIGTHQFVFYTTLINRAISLIGSDSHAIVGRDPLGASTAPLIYSEKKGHCEVWGAAGPSKGYRQVRPWQCIGMETMGTDSWHSIVERIESQHTSVQLSIERLAPYLAPGEMERVLTILGGQECRCFGEEENRLFELSDRA
jgi:hypothetical protein